MMDIGPLPINIKSMIHKNISIPVIFCPYPNGIYNRLVELDKATQSKEENEEDEDAELMESP
jgi:hypothetical protein